jgi:hypothetical protein
MPGLSAGWNLAILATGAVGLMVWVVLFRASCSLADVADPGPVRSVLVPVVAAAVALLLAATAPADPASVNLRMVGPMLALLIFWLVPALLYAPLIPMNWRKAVIVAGLEVVLMALLAALAGGVVLVILAAVQLTRLPPPLP